MKRSELLQFLVKKILDIKSNHPVRIGIDGVDASGKTFLANEIYDELKPYDREVIRVSIDGFHNPKKVRYVEGLNSARGYYKDSFNYLAIIQNVLAPLGKGGNLLYKKSVFDFRTDSEIVSEFELVRKDAVLIMDGVFLFRPELVSYWDFKIFIDVDFNVVLKRAVDRDTIYLGSEQNVLDKYTTRYIPGQRIYIEEVKPKQVADVVIANNDFENPELKLNGGATRIRTGE